MYPLPCSNQRHPLHTDIVCVATRAFRASDALDLYLHSKQTACCLSSVHTRLVMLYACEQASRVPRSPRALRALSCIALCHTAYVRLRSPAFDSRSPVLFVQRHPV